VGSASSPRARPLPGALRRELAAVARTIGTTLRSSLRLDLPIAVFAVVFLLLFAPLVTRNTDNPQLLAAYVNDEPFITMGLEAMLEPPYGNPGAYFDPKNPASQRIPEHWRDMSYPYITYYGGALFELAFPSYALLRAVGAPPFPTGPIVLRVLTLLAGLLSLIVLYNFAKDRGSRLAGLLAAAFLASDAAFIYYANYIHPDTLQMLFGLLAFLLAVRHARDGETSSLIALGLFCGLVQGAKSGVPWTVPMALLALWLGARTHSVAQLARRVGLLAAAALAAFFVSTPYAFVDTYYARAMRLAYGAVSRNAVDPTHPVTVLSWGRALVEYLGPVAVVLVLAAAARAVWVNRRGIVDPALVLAFVLAASQFLWYGISGRLWHVLGYLILSFGVVGVLAFETLLLGAKRLGSALPERLAPAATVAVVAVVAVFAADRWYTPADWTVEQHLNGRSTVRAANDWAVAHGVPRSSRIVFDDLAYFDRSRFPDAELHGGVLTWRDVERERPDYVVLSSSLFGADWMQSLIATQRLDRQDADAFNVRLYQDLLATDTPGPTDVPGVELAGVLRPALGRTGAAPPRACHGLPVCDLGVVDLGALIGRGESVERRTRALARSGDEPLTGPEIRIYRVRNPVQVG
jgi:hypothetical protein